MIFKFVIIIIALPPFHQPPRSHTYIFMRSMLQIIAPSSNEKWGGSKEENWSFYFRADARGEKRNHHE
jgi:hypothetical protein